MILAYFEYKQGLFISGILNENFLKLERISVCDPLKIGHCNICFPGIHFKCAKSSKQQNMRSHMDIIYHITHLQRFCERRIYIYI